MHASLTLAQALSALRQLPVTNPSLYHQITAGNTSGGRKDDEPVISVETDQDDRCDIPIDIVRSVVMAEGSVDGYTLDEEGSIVRTGIAEDSEQQTGENNGESSAILPAADLGRGRRVKIGSKRYDAEWEEH